MKIADDVFTIVCSFLQPLELCRARYLSSHYHKLCDNWLTKTFCTTHLQDHGCPNCGKLLYQNDEQKWEIENDPTFYDILYGDIEEIETSRMAYIENVHNMNNMNMNNLCRRRLLCEECDNEENELDKFFLRLKGDRKYHIHVVECRVYSWAFISLTTPDRKIYWNQLRAFIQPNYDYNYNDDYHEDEDEFYEYNDEVIEYMV